MCHLGAGLWRPALSGGGGGRACKRALRSAPAQRGCVLERTQECPTVRGWGRDRKSAKGQRDGLT